MYTSAPTYVRTVAELETLLDRLRVSPFVALDTEFLRERTYFPKFCLLQLATDDCVALIDVLALPTLLPVLDYLNDRTRIKILHAAHQDLEVLALANGAAHGRAIAPIAGPFFDTQVAAAFLGLPANIGYADLVQRRLNHTLAKGQARTDWSQRPLHPAQLGYAVDDVVYLVKLYHDLDRALRQAGRWEWVQEDARQLEAPSLYATEPSEAWRRLRGLEQLQPWQRAATKLLANWRERLAITKDLPRSWILADDVLRTLAERLPQNATDLSKIAELPRGTLEKRGAELLKLIADAKVDAAGEPPATTFRPSRAEQKRVGALMDFIRQKAAQLHVSPERLAARRDIEALVFGNQIGSFGQGWRYDAFGKELLELANKAGWAG